MYQVLLETNVSQETHYNRIILIENPTNTKTSFYWLYFNKFMVKCKKFKNNCEILSKK